MLFQCCPAFKLSWNLFLFSLVPGIFFLNSILTQLLKCFAQYALNIQLVKSYRLRNRTFFLLRKYTVFLCWQRWLNAGRNTGHISVPHWRISGPTPLAALSITPAVTAGGDTGGWQSRQSCPLMEHHVSFYSVQSGKLELVVVIRYCTYFDVFTDPIKLWLPPWR